VLNVGQVCSFDFAQCVIICSTEKSLAIPQFISEHLCIDEFTECSVYISSVC